MANSNGWGDAAANNSIGWGQGANNAIAWGDSHAKSWAGATDIVGITTDPDAQAFITAAAITDPTQRTAIDTLVKGMKADGLWTKMKAIYPFVGGTASAHKWNLKDPRDLDAAFRLVFNGGWTHSANGATPNGTNGYADTNLNPSGNITGQNSHISFYSRTQSDGLYADLGYGGSMELLTQTGNILYADFPDTTRSQIGNQNSTGLFIVSNTSTAGKKVFRNNSAIISSTFVNANFVANPLYKFTLSNYNNLSLSRYSNRQNAFASIGDGLTDTEAANLYTRVQAFQTALSRQV